MQRKILLYIIVMTFFLSSACSAAQWSDVISIAEKNNNELISARKQMDAAGWTLNRAYTNFLPNVSANASMTETTSGGSPEASKSYSMGLSATQYLFKGMENIYGLESAYADYEYYKANFQSIRAGVYYDVRSAFLDLLYAEENVVLLEKILEQRKENARLIRLRYESGKEDKGNLMRTEADQAEAEYNLSSAKRDLELARLKLSQLLGTQVDSAEGVVEVSSIEAPELDELAEKTPAYIMAKWDLKSAEIDKKSTISGFLPSVSLSGRWSKSGDEWPPERESSSWSLNLSYSLFPGGSNFIDTIIYDIRLDKAREVFEKSTKDVRYSLEESYKGFENALESLEVRKKSLAASEERAKIARVKYLNGLMTYDEWDRIERDYVNAQKTLLTSQKGALMAEAAWHKSYGGYVK